VIARSTSSATIVARAFAETLSLHSLRPGKLAGALPGRLVASISELVRTMLGNGARSRDTGGMETETKPYRTFHGARSGLKVLAVGLVILSVPVLYLASAGPAAYAAQRGWIDEPMFRGAYAPILAATRQSIRAAAIWTEYCQWWRNEAMWNSGPRPRGPYFPARSHGSAGEIIPILSNDGRQSDSAWVPGRGVDIHAD
jgi:hypothetical protein